MDNGLLTLGSLFDGIGGFPFAASIVGIKTVWAAEIDPACVAVTKNRFPDMEHLGSVTEINGADITPVDIIAFGSPCQDLSIAGNKAGLDGERSGLFKEAVRIIYEMRIATNGKYPTFIIWENVPGAFSSNKGRDFRTVLEEITKTDIPMPTSGKWATAGVVRSAEINVAWRQLDAQYWGVPQRRKRIYLVGSFGSNSAEEILFECDSVRGYLTPSKAARKGIAADTERSVIVGSECFDARGNGGGGVIPTMTGDHNSRVNDYCAIICQKTVVFDETQITSPQNGNNPKPNDPCHPLAATAKPPVLCIQGKSIGRADKNAPNGSGINENVSFTLNTVDQHAVVYALDRASFNQGANALYDFEISDAGINSTLVAKGPSAAAYGVDCRNAEINEELNGTLQAHTGGGFSLNTNNVAMYKFVEWIIRRLIPLECERLQGYPDGWTELPKINDMTDEDYSFFLKVFLLDKEIRGKPVKKPPTKASIVKWYNKLDCDGNRYRQLGNSLAIPCALRVIGGIADYIAKEREQ